MEIEMMLINVFLFFGAIYALFMIYDYARRWKRY